MSRDLKLTLVLKADGTAMVKGVNKADAALDNLQNTTDAAQTKLKALTAQGKRFSNVISAIKQNALGVVGFGLAANSLLSLTDSIKETNARLKMATGSQQAFNQAQEQSKQIAKAARADYLSTANLYSRLSTAADQYGVSQDKVSKTTAAVTYGLKLYGASAAEVSSVQTQLSQALASGTLAGDEFKSMAEASPRLMQALADSLGVARGDLKKMASDGLLTTQIVINALAEQSAALQEEFANMPITVSEAWGQIKNTFVQGVSYLDGVTGVTEKISQGLMFVADHLGDIAKVAVVATVGMASFYAVQKVQLLYSSYKSLIALEIALGGVGKRAAISAVAVKYFGRATKSATLNIKALTLAIAANPIGFLVTAITVAITALVAFRHQITPVKGSLATLGDYGAVVFDFLKKVIYSLFKPLLNLRESWHKVTESIVKISKPAQQTFKTIGDYIAKFLKFVKEVVNKYIGFWVGAYYATKEAFKDFPRVLGDIAVRAANAALEAVNKFVRSTATLLNKVPGVEIDVSAIGFKKIANHAAGAGANVAAEFKRGMNIDYIGNAANVVMDKITDIGAAWKAAAEEKYRLRISAEEKHKSPSDTLAAIQLLNNEKEDSKAKKQKGDKAEDAAKKALEELKRLQQKAADFVAQQRQKVVDYAFETSLIGKQADEVERLRFEHALLTEQKKVLKGLSKSDQHAIKKQTAAILEQYAAETKLRAEKQSQKQVEDFAKQQSSQLADYAFETSLIGKKTAEIERLKFERNLLNQAEQAGQNLTKKGKQLLAQEIEQIMAKHDAQVALREQQQALQGQDWVGGMKSGLESLVDNAKNLYETMEDATKDAFNKMSDSLATFVATGKGNFKDLTVSILQDISKMLIKFAMLKLAQTAVGMFSPDAASAIGKVLPFAKGGAFNSQGIQYYANGDIFNQPTAFRHAGGIGVMGEAGPEAVMPLTRGPNGKLGVQVFGNKQANQSSGVNLVSNVTINYQGDNSKEENNKMHEFGKFMKQHNEAAMNAWLAKRLRPGEPLYDMINK